MNRIDPSAIEKLIEEHLVRLSEEQPEQFETSATADDYLKNLQGIAREINGSFVPEGADWVSYLSQVFPKHENEKILVGLFGLGHDSAELDDLFGERASGWARELKDKVVTDILASIIVWWVLDDHSRIGYLESWAARGENIWKKRLAASTTAILNETDPDLTNESLKVLRHLMESEEVEILNVISRTLKKASDQSAVERFVAWWQPRITVKSLDIILNDLDEAIQNNIRDLF